MNEKTAVGHPCSAWIRLWVFCLVLRIGEAAHPGPDPTWTCGIFNPSGLTTKIDCVVDLPGDIWFGSETHLTRAGIARLRQGLKAQKSKFRYVVPGAPCSHRVNEDAGTYAGVVALSSFPARPLPHSFDADLYRTARIQVCGIAIRQTWLQVGILYGFPHSAIHKQRTYRTECLLDELISRVGLQAVGPRIICGDFNHSASSLQQLRRLYLLGWREVQECAALKWGQLALPTSSGNDIIDQMWISPELQAVLESVEVSWEHWASHASVQVTFRHFGSELDKPCWPQPRPFPWPDAWGIPPLCFDWSNPTLAYGSWWHQLEHVAAWHSASPVPGACFGRGQTLRSTTRSPYLVPVKQGRVGDEQPQHFGASLQYSRWFKQLRRLHSLARHSHLPALSATHVAHMLEVWRAVKNAVGFPRGFGSWWIEHHVGSPFACYLPVELPTPEQLSQMFQLFRKDVRSFEVELGKQRLAEAKSRRLTDASLVFKDCMKEQPQAVDSLVRSVEIAIEEVREDDLSVVLAYPCVVSVERPLVVEGRTYEVLFACHDQVWLSSVDGLEPGLFMRQESTVTTDTGILHEFEKVWKERWIKLDHVTSGQWQQIGSFCARVFRPISWSFPSWTLAAVRKGLASKKKKAATGLDGISRDDLLQLPDEGLAPVLQLFSHLESGGEWPEQLTQGYVNCLDKHKGDGWVDSYRPIVIYPVLARLWSSCRAKQALLSVGPCLPGGLHGGVPKKQAKSIWFQLAQRIEQAHADGASLQGIAVDIQRAFNNIPREPIWNALIQLGLPSNVLRPWASFVASQARRFSIRGAIGNPLFSNSGFPEGCAWSVFAMSIADWMLTSWMSWQVSSPHDTYSFVDDWHVVFIDPRVFDEIWAALFGFTQSMGLTLDLQKSFCWAAQSADRRLLAQAPISSVLAARDLGAHQNFSLRSGNKTLLSRLENLSDLWPKLRKSVAPYRNKLFVLTQMAWPRSLHGISVVHLGLSRYVTLRSGAMKGLRVNRIGANPMLRFMSHGVLCDPESWAILQTVRELREVGSLDQMAAMLSFKAVGEYVPPNGPCAILVSRLSRLGWTLCPDGQFYDLLGRIDVLHASWPDIVARVQWSWPRVVAAEVSHRSDLDGIQFADVAEVRRVLATLGPSDQKLFQCCLDATMYHDLKKSKSERGSLSKCLCCGAADSVFHRLWECPFFEHCRTSCNCLRIIRQLPACLSCHGWPLIPPPWYALAQHFLMVPPVMSLAPAASFDGCSVVHLFVDGACNHPAEPKLRYAAWGVTHASPAPCTLDHRILAFGHVHGLTQTAFRGELTAMVYALRIAGSLQKATVIWSDCESVVSQVRRILDGWVPRPNQPHSDFWDEIASMVSAGMLQQVSIQQVCSHCDVSGARNDVEAWGFWHNKLVDNLVGLVNKRRSSEFWQAWEATKSSLEASRELHSEIVGVMLQVGRAASSMSTKSSATLEAAQPVETPIIEWPGKWLLHKKVEKKYCAGNARRLHEWWLEVGVPSLASKQPLRWISGLQLFADFFLHTGWTGPISPRHGRWFETIADAPVGTQYNLASRSKAFLRMWKAYMVANGVQIPAKVQKPWAYSIGYWTQCYRVPWPDDRLRWIDDAIFALSQRQLVRPKELERYVACR